MTWKMKTGRWKSVYVFVRVVSFRCGRCCLCADLHYVAARCARHASKRLVAAPVATRFGRMVLNIAAVQTYGAKADQHSFVSLMPPSDPPLDTLVPCKVTLRSSMYLSNS